MNSSRECARVLISRYGILFIQSIVFVFFLSRYTPEIVALNTKSDYSLALLQSLSLSF